MRKRRVKAVIEESSGALHTNLTLPWYAFVLSPNTFMSSSVLAGI